MVDEQQFRAALGRFASGVTVVTTVLDGIDHVMTASAFTSVSLVPPQVLVCADRTARFHAAVLESRTWGVTILSDRGRETSAWFAKRGRPLEDQLDKCSYRRSPGGLAVLDTGLAWMECRTSAVHDGGDHSIIVGDVVWAEVATSGADDPLLYYRSHYGTIIRSVESEKTLQEEADA
ncbi:MAG TPA: flavin reductase family protein [Aeromicrobium sp.]|nr:flavin reductase family protein [Aeromicrobium sp.]